MEGQVLNAGERKQGICVASGVRLDKLLNQAVELPSPQIRLDVMHVSSADGCEITTELVWVRSMKVFGKSGCVTGKFFRDLQVSLQVWSLAPNICS